MQVSFQKWKYDRTNARASLSAARMVSRSGAVTGAMAPTAAATLS